MADFSSVPNIMNDISAAQEIVKLFQEIHKYCGRAITILNRYNSDPDFKAQADHLYTSQQLAEIGNMINDVSTLKTHWEADHSSVLIQYTPPPPNV
jgi:hypothetical protein